MKHIFHSSGRDDSAGGGSTPPVPTAHATTSGRRRSGRLVSKRTWCLWPLLSLAGLPACEIKDHNPPLPPYNLDAGRRPGQATSTSTSTDTSTTTPPKDGVDLWHKKADRGKVVDPGKFVSTEAASGKFPLVANGKAAPIVVSKDDYDGVVRVADDLSNDILQVTKVKPTVANDVSSSAKEVVLLGSLGKSPLIDKLVSGGKLKVDAIKGKWETFTIQAVDNPMQGVTKALVIVGSDQRGAIFGAYELSRQIGVSPWYWWDDVPAQSHEALYVDPAAHSQGEPAVKFRGFFINDENPTTGRWARKKFGEGKAKIEKPTCDNDAGTDCVYNEVSYGSGLTHEYWEKIFEVALRLKANYIWPAVWGRQFADDDPENLPTAKKYGIVVGTSHEAPMMRGIEEWNTRVDPTKRDGDGGITHKGTDPWGGTGEWAWTRNPEALKKYWTEGIQRMVDIGFDGVVTLAMRGTGDVAADETGKIDVLSDVLDAQRKILTDVVKKPLTSIPQVWLLYKEVQTYWDKGMRPADDVTIIWCDDNWGNMRKLQDPAVVRSGGYGIYYHFDYVGAGRNYKWIDTNLLPNVWEQLNLAYSYGVDRLWLVNVGDMKNEEAPLQFFLDYAWSPERWPVEDIPKWEKEWAEQQFGAKYAEDIAKVLHDYSKLQSDRKPELTNRKINFNASADIVKDPNSAVWYSDEAYFAKNDAGVVPPAAQRTEYDHNPFSLTSYREMETVVANWDALAKEAARIGDLLPDEYKDAYYELVGYEVKASANMYALRLAQFKNILYYQQGRASTADLRQVAEDRLADDKAMSNYYNKDLAGGKWAEWQTQPKIGYGDQDRYGTNAPWQQPETNNEALEDAIYPLLKTPSEDAGVPSGMGVVVEGSTAVATQGTTAKLPTFSPEQSQPVQYFEVFGRGTAAFDFTVDAPEWMTVTLTPDTHRIDETHKDVRAEVKVKWSDVPEDATSGEIKSRRRWVATA